MTRLATPMAGSAIMTSMVLARKNEGDGGDGAEKQTITGGEVGKVEDVVQTQEGAGTEKPAETVAAAEPAKTKSIVPTGWKSKDDELKQFIDKQCVGKDGFEMPAFFELCRKNGIAEDKVKHYEDLVTAKAHGVQGRAKMTLRNMLATPARKNGKLIALDGSEVAISIVKPALTGAAVKAQEAAETKTETAGATA